MVLEDMIAVLRDVTKVFNNDAMLIRQLNSALDYVWQRLYSVCPDLKITFESTGTLSVDTQQFNLAAQIALLGGDVYYASKTFWIKGASDTDYIPVVFMDVNDERFLIRDQMDTQVIQPAYVSAVNFGEIRFAPTLPSGTMWRSDWIGKPPNFSLQTQCTTSIPEPLHQAVTDKATSTVFSILDDTREGTWEQRAENKIILAIHTIKKRQNQTREGTSPYPAQSVPNR